MSEAHQPEPTSLVRESSIAKMRVRVYHGVYGCETGCCGHWVEIDGGLGDFIFGHPSEGDDFRAWAKEKVMEELRSRHPGCIDSIDWETMAIDEMASYDTCNW